VPAKRYECPSFFLFIRFVLLSLSLIPPTSGDHLFIENPENMAHYLIDHVRDQPLIINR